MAESSARVAEMSAVKLALLAKQMRSQVDEVLRAEPIAIIGMGCRVPGANSLEAFWQLLIDGSDMIREVPEGRWDIDTLYDPDFNAPGKISSRWGGFLDQIDQFDPTFFGITPREAQRMDPQQRLFLEVVYEALEDAGLTHSHLNESQTGVFVASYHNDYTQLQYEHPDLIDGRTLTGALQSIVSNRLSFLFNMHGPSLTVDTACSSSLVTVHLACQNLRNRECDLAVAGGVSVMMNAELNIAMSRVGFLSPTGRCRTFDAGADGFVRGEGCGVVILKRFSDAIADGDSIRAIIRGSMVNQDGRSNVLTAPNGMAHRQLIRAALDHAGVKPEQIGYVEAHGTGTALGDPIEVEALADVLGKGEQPCVLSSVKTNIGHLEAAAGVVGLIKLVLSLEHEAIPGNVHFTKLNPHISLEGTRLVISNTPQPWVRGNSPRFAGVSSFGVGGTNGHVIVEEAPLLPSSAQKVDAQKVDARSFLLPLSAHTSEALQAQATHLRDWLKGGAAFTLNDLCYTASVRRSHYDDRLSVVGTSPEELADQLDGFVRGETRPGVYSNQGTNAEGKLAFVFSGQGPQWWAMGRELLAEEPVFRQAIEQIDGLLRPYTRWSLLEELQADETRSRLDQTEVAQPAILALQVALAALWRAWGIVPDAVVGHSVGEIAAAHVAGILTIEDAVRVVYHRARLMQRATGHGKMAAVELSAAEMERILASSAHNISIAAVNSPTSVTLSGEPAALETLLGDLKGKGVATKMLRVNYAFHSSQMEAFQAELVTSLAGLQPGSALIPIISTVSGGRATSGDYGADYWARNIRQPVQFADAVDTLMSEGVTTFVEISPHPALLPALEQCLQGNGVVFPSLRRERRERAVLLTTLGGVYIRGYLPDRKGLYAQKGQHVRLPTYPWQHQRYWLDVPKQKRRAPVPTEGHPLLGKRLRSPSLTDIVYEVELGSEWPPFLSDHCIHDIAVLPATAYVDMVLAGLAVETGQSYNLNEVLIQEVLALRTPRTVQTILRQDGAGFVFEVVSRDDNDSWKRHASGQARLVETNLTEAMPETNTLAQAQAQCMKAFAPADHYQLMQAQGLSFGERFQGIQALKLGTGEVLAYVELPAAAQDEADAYRIYPPLLDACLQALSVAFNLQDMKDIDDIGEELYLPLNMGHLHLNAPLPKRLWSHAQMREMQLSQKPLLRGDVYLYNDAGEPVGTLQNFQFIRTTHEGLARALDITHEQPPLFYETRWQEEPLSSMVPLAKEDKDANWLVVGAKSLCAQVAAKLRQAGNTKVVEVAVDGSMQPVATYRHLLNGSKAKGTWHVVYLAALDIALDADPQASQRLVIGELLPLLALFQQPPVLYLITKGAQPVAGNPVTAPAQATLWGLANTLRLEFPTWRCLCIDLDPADLGIDLLLNEITHTAQDEQVAYRNHQRYVARFAPLTIASSEASSDGALHLEIPASHLVDDLAFQPVNRNTPRFGEVEVRVMATGLNFRDLLKTLGMYPGPAGPLGDECAGVVVAVGAGVESFKVGDRVVGVVAGAFASYVTTSAKLLVHLPASISDEDAASIPIAYLTAYYALHHLAHLQAGQRVLIHAAAGGVGLAAVQLALAAGAKVIGTAGSEKKRAFLKSLGVEHVFDSRTLTFADEIMEVTQGEGVDVVLNSLAGDFIPHSLRVLQAHGAFLEIGKTDIWESTQVAAVKPNAAYHVIFLADQFESEPDLIRSLLTDIVEKVANGQLPLLPMQLFAAQEVAQAFRYMAHAKQIGKIVVTHHAYKAVIRGEGTYLITGGLGGIGVEVATWLAKQGARSLLLMGRHAPSQQAAEAIDQLRGGGVQVRVIAGNVASADDVQRALDEVAATLPPFRGIFHAAGVNEDGVLLKLDWSRFESVMQAKIAGAWNLHRLTQHLVLDHFVLFSSIAANLGSVGQANYGAANSFLDALAHWRQGQGLPALSINWGPWARLGMTAVLSSTDVERTQRRGLHSLTTAQSLKALGELLAQNKPQASVLDIDWKKFARSQQGQEVARFYTDLVQPVQPVQPKAPTQKHGNRLVTQLQETPLKQRRLLLINHIRKQAGLVMGLPATLLNDTRQPLNTMGLDSLMAVELRNALGQSINQSLPATLVFDFPTLDALTDYLLNEILEFSDARSPEAAPAVQTTAADDLAALSDDEAEALLLAELMRPKKKDSPV